ncbi:MAG: 50S ribosomal protein L19 [Patescibacteria group bacterium]|nr:50S ribosomal protein L19 [Patescibacteria group bacterium]
MEQALEEAKAAKAVEAIELPKIKAGMLVRVHHKIKEMSAKGEEKERIQIFEGLVIGAHGAGNKKTFTVRKVASGVGVEKIFPVSAPAVAKVEVIKQYRMRRAQPTYLRKGYKKKLKEVAVK